jgi:predicted nuclease of predicted toxin-antitoxin system
VRIKLDENLPAGLEPLLAALGHDVATVPAEGIGGEDDDVVWRAAPADGRFLVTQDLDFSDARKYAPGTHHGLLLVCCWFGYRSLVASPCRTGAPGCFGPKRSTHGPVVW